MMGNRKPNGLFGLVGLALLLLALMLAIVPFVAQDLSPEAFRAQCELKLQEVRAAEQEVIHGGQDPAERLDGAKEDFEGFGCTWDMFDEMTATVSAGAPSATPAVYLTATFEAECQQGLQTYLYEQGRVDRGERQPEDSLDDAINNFLGHGCTWNMFDEPTATVTAVTPVTTITATVTPMAPTATITANVTPLAPTATPAVDPAATFEAECYQQLQVVIYEQGRVERGEKQPEDSLDDAINNFLGHGCTWDMFE